MSQFNSAFKFNKDDVPTINKSYPQIRNNRNFQFQGFPSPSFRNGATYYNNNHQSSPPHVKFQNIQDVNISPQKKIFEIKDVSGQTINVKSELEKIVKVGGENDLSGNNKEVTTPEKRVEVKFSPTITLPPYVSPQKKIFEIKDTSGQTINVQSELEKIVKVGGENDLSGNNKEVTTLEKKDSNEIGNDKKLVESTKIDDSNIKTELNVSDDKVQVKETPEKLKDMIENSIKTENSKKNEIKAFDEESQNESNIQKSEDNIKEDSNVNKEDKLLLDQIEKKSEESSIDLLDDDDQDLDEDFGYEVKMIFDEGSWCPSNKDLPKVFSNSFLLQYKEHFKIVPEGFVLPEITVVPKEDFRSKDFRSNEFRSNQGKSFGGNRSKNTSYNKRRPDRKKSESVWTRPDIQQSDEIQKKKFEVIRLLNKLSKINFDKYSEKLVRCCYSDSVHTEILVDCLYTKAVTEPNFSVLYADLCLKLSKIKVGYKSVPQTNFRTLVIKRCQHEFENKQRPPPISPDLKPEERFELEEKGNKIKKRNDGAVIFIGELYLRDLLNIKVMTFCFHELLTDNAETSDIYDLENYTKLMTTIGSKLEANNKSEVEKNVELIASLSKSKALIPRLRFLFLDLFDLRKRNWVPKQKKEPPQESKDTGNKNKYQIKK
jgi:hypothetical protein